MILTQWPILTAPFVRLHLITFNYRLALPLPPTTIKNHFLGSNKNNFHITLTFFRYFSVLYMIRVKFLQTNSSYTVDLKKHHLHENCGTDTCRFSVMCLLQKWFSCALFIFSVLSSFIETDASTEQCNVLFSAKSLVPEDVTCTVRLQLKCLFSLEHVSWLIFPQNIITHG